jgi:hypothetical protein
VSTLLNTHLKISPQSLKARLLGLQLKNNLR